MIDSAPGGIAGAGSGQGLDQQPYVSAPPGAGEAAASDPWTQQTLATAAANDPSGEVAAAATNPGAYASRFNVNNIPGVIYPTAPTAAARNDPGLAGPGAPPIAGPSAASSIWSLWMASKLRSMGGW